AYWSIAASSSRPPRRDSAEDSTGSAVPCRWHSRRSYSSNGPAAWWSSSGRRTTRGHATMASRSSPGHAISRRMPDSRSGSPDSGRVALEAPDDPLHEAAAPETSLGEAAVSGSLWTILQVVVVKVASFASTVVLMHLLPPELFGIATLALSVQAMVTLLQ